MSRFNPDPSGWNGWELEAGHLNYPAYLGGGCYPIDLEDRAQSSGRMLDIIMQVANKGWATDACIAGLVRALNEIINPQAHLCSGGGNKRLTTEKIKELVEPLQ